MVVHGPILRSEFALVGCGKRTNTEHYDEPFTMEKFPADLMKERSNVEFHSYATGRQNIAWLDLKLNLARLPNIPRMAFETFMSLFLDRFTPPRQYTDAIVYPFDGNEKKFVLSQRYEGSDEGMAKSPSSVGSSSYDGFVFAIVHKDAMRRLRDERYDISLTYTKDHAKLPDWTTVMSEAAEITDTMLTPDLIAAVERAGDAFHYLIITDQPIDRPTRISEASPRKRLYLRTAAPFNDDYSATIPLWAQLLRLPDRLVQEAHFRPEVLKKISHTREAEVKKLRKVGDEEAEEERKKQAEKVKKEERDRKTRGMTAEEQRKFLERESERKRKKDEKKMTRKG